MASREGGVNRVTIGKINWKKKQAKRERGEGELPNTAAQKKVLINLRASCEVN